MEERPDVTSLQPKRFKAKNELVRTESRGLLRYQRNDLKIWREN
jgi:hypothetical protein